MIPTTAFKGCITFRGRDISFTAEILPAKDSPHVSYDSPRKWIPPTRTSIHSYTLFDDEGRDITNRYFYYRAEIRVLILAEWKAEKAARA